jgi:hypothetical protein
LLTTISIQEISLKVNSLNSLIKFIKVIFIRGFVIKCGRFISKLVTKISIQYLKAIVQSVKKYDRPYSNPARQTNENTKIINKSPGRAGTEKPGFWREYWVTTRRFSKNPVSLLVMRKSP